MLKFQNDYTTLFATFEDFILLVYTVIDDLYQQFAPACVSQRRNADSARMSDLEIITLSICGELIGMDSENAWVLLCQTIAVLFGRTALGGNKKPVILRR